MDEQRQVPAAIGAFLFASLGWLLVVGVVTGIAIAVAGMGTGLTFEEVSVDTVRFFTPTIMGASALLQSLGLGGIAIALAFGLSDDRTTAIRTAIGERTSWWGWTAAGAVGALTVGLLPGWLASEIVTRFPDLGGTLAFLADALQKPDPIGKLLLVLAICVSAPIFEEIAFRGYLWRHLELVMPGWAVWLTTSVVFAAYHLDPVQSPSLVPTALFLGWLRWQSGSIVPAVAAHAVNNLLGAWTLLYAGSEDASQISLGVAVLATCATLVCCVAAWLARPRT